jgi:hypothetical protein
MDPMADEIVLVRPTSYVRAIDPPGLGVDPRWLGGGRSGSLSREASHRPAIRDRSLRVPRASTGPPPRTQASKG